MVNWCNAYSRYGYGRGSVPDPGQAWWQFWKHIACPACGGDGIAKPPGWPNQAEMDRLRPPPPGVPPRKPIPPSIVVIREGDICVREHG